MRRAAAIAAVILASAGCGPTGFLASPADYAAYRRTRIAPSLEDRLAAADTYLTRYPDGAFRDPVKEYFDHAELVFFKAKQGSIAGLEDYLRALPNGPHAAAATSRIDALQVRRDTQEAALGGLAAEMTTKLDRAGAERRRVRAEITAWIGRFLDPAVWIAPLSQAKDSVIVPWILELPSPSCRIVDKPSASMPAGAARRCVKLLELPYTVRVNGVDDPRQATVEIAMIEDPGGKPIQVSIGGPDLFLRLEETLALRALDAGDTGRRVEAVAHAADLVAGEYSRAVSADPACKRPVVAPVFLDLACKGVRATARAWVEAGEDDLVVISPSAAPP